MSTFIGNLGTPRIDRHVFHNTDYEMWNQVYGGTQYEVPQPSIYDRVFNPVDSFAQPSVPSAPDVNVPVAPVAPVVQTNQGYTQPVPAAQNFGLLPQQQQPSWMSPSGFLASQYGTLPGVQFNSAPGMFFSVDTNQAPAAAEASAPATVTEEITAPATDLGTSVVEEGAATAFQLETQPQPQPEDPVRRAAEEYVKLEIPDYDPAKGVFGWLIHPDSAVAVEGRERVEQERAARVEELVGGKHIPDLLGYHFGKTPRHDAYRSFLDAKIAARGGEPPAIDPTVQAMVEPIVAAADTLRVRAEEEAETDAVLEAFRAESPMGSPVGSAVEGMIADKRAERATTYDGRLLEAMWEQDPEAAAGVEWTKHASEWQSYKRQHPDVAVDDVPEEFADIAKMSDSDIITRTALYKDNAGVKNFRRAAALYDALPADVQVTLMGDGEEIKVGGWSAVRDAGISYFTRLLEAEIAKASGLPPAEVKQIVENALSDEARGEIIGTLNSADVSPGDGLAALKSAFAPVDTAVRDLAASRMLTAAGVIHNGSRVTDVIGLHADYKLDDLNRLADNLTAIGRETEASDVRAVAGRLHPVFEKLKGTKYDLGDAHDRIKANLEAKVSSEWDDGFEAHVKKFIGIKLNEVQSEQEEAIDDLLNSDPADYTRALARFQRRWDMISQKADGDIDAYIMQNSAGTARSNFLKNVRNDGKVDWNVENMLMAGTLLLAFYGPFERRESERRAEKRADRRYDEDWERQQELLRQQNEYALQRIEAQGEASGGGSVAAVRPARF